MLSLLYADDLVCVVSGKRLKKMMGLFVEASMRKDLEISADKSKVMVLGEEKDWSVKFL